MKKYLMTGIAALAMFAGFTACSSTDDYSFNEEEYAQLQIGQMQAQYEQAFVKVFGKAKKNHDWGFGDNTTRTADPRGNMWADEGWNVPPVITDAQKDIVRRYFQQNTPLGYNDPGWSDFWIQQVYKGGTKTTDGSKTTEKYTIGNGDEVTGGNHMDHLCSKSASGVEDHVNDFNNSDNNDFEGRMLMVGSSTYSFGYINSNATAIHYDKAALVNWRVIAQWAVDKGLESSVESSVLNDGWNRSYMGFDWEQALPDDCYRPIYDYNAGWSADLPGGFPILGYATFEFEGNTYRYLSANANQYAYDETETTFGGKKNYNDKPSDDIIRQLLSLGYLPYSDTQKDWIKLSTGADGYYSDWIVTLTEANKGRKADLRVMAEDLSADDASDFDFNDVVFDVFFSPNEGEAYIEVLAAGGTLPLTINGTEVHNLFEVDQDYMVNTHAEAKNLKGGSGLGKKKIVLTGITVNSKTDANQKIHIKVTKPIKNAAGELVPTEIELVNSNAAACKIGVDPSYNWADERTCINDIYQFNKWVTEGGQLEPTNP